MYLNRCFFCRKLWCKHKECHAPGCRATCIPSATDLNCDWFAICADCYNEFMQEFERQFPHRKQLPKKIKIEEDDDCA